LTKLEAELYALTHRGNPGDRAFYAKSCAKAQRILELGTGYGRLIPDLLSAGTRPNPDRAIVGLDSDPSLLATAKHAVGRLTLGLRGQVKLLHGDMRDFDLGARFDRIILPYNGLFCLLNRRDILRCFTCVKRHLAPDGEFIFDVWAADRFHRDMQSNSSSQNHRDDSAPIVSFAHRAEVWDVFEKSRLRTRLQRLDVMYTYISQRRGTRVTIPIEQRYAPSGELIELVTGAGLCIKAIYGNFGRQRFRANSPQVVIRAGLGPLLPSRRRA
jgi:SAM-dependent methyltransferase